MSGISEAEISRGREVKWTRNVVALFQDGKQVIAYTPEEWAAMVRLVGIAPMSDEGMASMRVRERAHIALGGAG